MKDRVVKIFNTKYKIKFVDSIPSTIEGGFTFGICESQLFTIKVAIKDKNGKPLDKSIIRTSLMHELMHAILIEGQYLGYSEDEPLVEWMAKCICSLLDQKIFNN